MSFTPICPDCGSAAVKDGGAPRLQRCQRCGFVGARSLFIRARDRITDGVDARKGGDAVADRTIGLWEERSS